MLEQGKLALAQVGVDKPQYKRQIMVTPGLDIGHLIGIPADPHRGIAGEALAGKGRQSCLQRHRRWKEGSESW